PLAPNGAKPPPLFEEKLLPLKVTISSTMIVSVGTASFQIIVMLFDSASHRTPMMLIHVKIAMQTPATAIPDPVSVPLEWTKPGSSDVDSRYVSAASTSIGAIVTAWIHAIHPPVKPPSAPKLRNGKRAVPPDSG